MFADFIKCGNLLNFNDSLNSVSRTGTNISILSLIILVGISEDCEVLNSPSSLVLFQFQLLEFSLASFYTP